MSFVLHRGKKGQNEGRWKTARQGTVSSQFRSLPLVCELAEEMCVLAEVWLIFNSGPP